MDTVEGNDKNKQNTIQINNLKKLANIGSRKWEVEIHYMHTWSLL